MIILKFFNDTLRDISSRFISSTKGVNIKCMHSLISLRKKNPLSKRKNSSQMEHSFSKFLFLINDGKKN